MQQTRLNILLSTLINQFRDFITNPWRKLSFIIIGWLLGFALPTALTASISQDGAWDTSVALVFLIFTESISIIIYGRRKSEPRPWWIDILNSFKIGFIYCLYLDASILTS